MTQVQRVAFLLITAIIAAGLSLSVQSTASANADLADGLVSGVVWQDSNNNGIREPGEALLADHPVYLQRTGEEVVGAMVAVTFTDHEGTFLFENLEQGTYQVSPDAGAYILVDVQGVNATAMVELSVPSSGYQIFLPFTVR